MISPKFNFQGYRRENRRVGIRNHVIILPVDDLSNAAAEAVANNVKGAMAIPHPYGRLQFGADLDLHFRTLIGAGSNPNVAAVVVIGIAAVRAVFSMNPMKNSRIVLAIDDFFTRHSNHIF